MNKKKFDFLINQNTLKISVCGFFNSSDAHSYIEEYNRCLKNINPSSINLTLDCTSLEIVHRDVLPLLEECFRMYKDSGFKCINMLLSSNQDGLKDQLFNLSQKINLNLKFIHK